MSLLGGLDREPVDGEAQRDTGDRRDEADDQHLREVVAPEGAYLLR